MKRAQRVANQSQGLRFWWAKRKDMGFCSRCQRRHRISRWPQGHPIQRQEPALPPAPELVERLGDPKKRRD